MGVILHEESDTLVYRVPLTQGQYTIVDLEDAPEVLKYKWHVINNRYAQTTVGKKHHTQTNFALEKGKRNAILLHRFLLKTPKGLVTDHKNHNGLDNRRENLRICTTQQNCFNQQIQGNPLGYKGVSLSPENTFKARLMYSNKTIYIGTFPTAIDAAKAYDVMAQELFGEFAQLNFPNEVDKKVLTKRLLKINSTRLRGVYKKSRRSSFQARIKGIYIGTYRTPEEAARAYDKKAKELFGDKAILNFLENIS